MIPIGPERHVRSADLLRFVDGEGNTAFRERVSAHLAGCADCTAAAARLRENTARVLNRLNVLDDATAADKLPKTFAELAQQGSHRQAHSPRVSWRRAAVIILFVGAGAAVARPAAAWLEKLINSDKPSKNVTAVQPTSAKPALLPVDTTSAAYSFTPASNELRIQFANAEPDAELIVRAYDENAASFELQSTSALPPVLILPNAVRITNAANRGTRYELALPRNVEVLVVSIAGHSPQRVPTASLPARIPLQSSN